MINIRMKPEVFEQIIRFGFSGVFLTVTGAAAYWAIAEWLYVDPNISLAIVFIIFSFIGYALHSRWSFVGHGGRDRPHLRLFRFIVSNMISLLTNQLFVWVLVKMLKGPTWWPIIPMVFLTPWLTFSLNRQWVFALNK